MKHNRLLWRSDGLKSFALAAGTKLGYYEFLSQIGACRMGKVYRARTSLDRDLAIKVLSGAML